MPAGTVTFAGIAVMLVLVSAPACPVPAWRASRLQPGRALAVD